MAVNFDAFSFDQHNVASAPSVDSQATSMILTSDIRSYEDDIHFSPLDRFALSPLSLDAAIGDLSDQFGLQNLHLDAANLKRSAATALPTSLYPLDDLALPAEAPSSPTMSSVSDTRSNSIAWSDVSTGSSTSLPHSNYHHNSIRRRRQEALRRQCSATGLREISDLVARMVETGEQCAVCNSSKSQLSVPHLEVQPASVDDSMDTETDDDVDETSRPSSSCSTSSGAWLKYKRSSDFPAWEQSSSKSSVTKDVRWRKHSRRRRTAAH